MAILGLCGCAGFSLVEMSRGYSTDALHRLLIAAVSLVAKHGLQGTLASVVETPRLQNTGSIVLAKGLSCSMVCGIFPDQGLNLSPPLAGRFFTTELPGKPYKLVSFHSFKVYTLSLSKCLQPPGNSQPTRDAAVRSLARLE